ncbi:tetratricopeptide repeat protein [Caulobacter sp. CCUG 60055]|uniref:tetratricopeptide repeat protein n=1 Tax=Caulobacter sp. CCUG 60055 TaxID=2100090 RepID=UPI00325B162A
MSLPLPLLGLSLLFSILLCVHVVRSGREMYWLFIILMFQPLGGLVYLVAIVMPEMMRGPAARKMGEAARDTLDPQREYREARQACDDSPTVHNRMKLAAAAADLGRHDEAEALYREAAQGVHADDPALLTGRARALVELNRPAEALALLEQLDGSGDAARTPQATLTRARAYQALGRVGEADRAYQDAVVRFHGLEALARQAAFLAEAGRKGEAQAVLADIDGRIAKANPHFRKEGRAWRDFAAMAVAGR